MWKVRTYRQEHQHQVRLRNDPMYAFQHHVIASTCNAPPPIDQPMACNIHDPLLQQAHAEEQFYAGQLSSGYQVMQSGMVDTAADEQNLRLFQQNSQHFGLPEQAPEFNNAMQQGYPALQQQCGTAPEPTAPVMDPIKMMLGGW